MQQTDKKKPQVLQDHKKVGRRLVPPFTQMVPNMTEVSYVKRILPEVLWIAVLIAQLGEAEGTTLALEIARASASLNPIKMMGLCSNYAGHDEISQSKIFEALRDPRMVSELLSPLCAPYPQCPLAFLCLAEHLDDSHVEAGIDLLLQLLPELYDKRSRAATMAQAGATYIAFCTDKLEVNEGTALAEFPEIEHYPDNDLSMRVASGIRALMNVVVETDSGWPRYFWNRGYEISPCVIGDLQ